MIVLGIDPGTVRIGVGIIEKNGGTLTCLDVGLLSLEKKYKNDGDRLYSIECALKKIIKKYKISLVGIETLYFSKNQKTALAVSEARGVILKTIAEHKIPYIEISPSGVKLAVAGDGRAKKEMVAHMVGISLHISTNKIIDDATDALAIAIASCYTKKY